MPKAVIAWSTGERGGRHANGAGAGGACISVPRHCCKLQDAASGCGGEGGQQHTCAYQQALHWQQHWKVTHMETLVV